MEGNVEASNDQVAPVAAADSSAPSMPPTAGIVGAPAGRGRGRGRGRGGGGIAIEGLAELDASISGGGGPGGLSAGKPVPKADRDFRGPQGLFKKSDWTCTVCGNVNWERRQACNKCNNPKPNVVTTDEAREGTGGGFDERQDRASVATVEVDADGYDDFGRKKIKARADKKAKEMAALARLRKSFGGGVLGVTSLAPSDKVPVPGQFDDVSASGVGNQGTTYDDFSRPRPSDSEFENGRSNGDDRNDRGGSSSNRGRSGHGDRERDRDRDRDRERDRERDRDRSRGEKDRHRRRERSWSRERGRDGKDRDRSRRRYSRSRSRERRR